MAGLFGRDPRWYPGKRTSGSAYPDPSDWRNETVETRWSEPSLYQSRRDAVTPSSSENKADAVAKVAEAGKGIAEWLKQLHGGK